MKVKVSRAFSQKKQIREYEPIEAFCAAEVEYELVSPIVPGRDSEEMLEMSERLDKFVRAEVAKTIQDFEPVCSICHGREIYSTSNDNPMVGGAHKRCRDIEQIKLREAGK